GFGGNAVINLKAPGPLSPDAVSLRDSGSGRSRAVAHPHVGRGAELGNLPNIDLAPIAAKLNEGRGRLDAAGPAPHVHAVAVAFRLDGRVSRNRGIYGRGPVHVGQMR